MGDKADRLSAIQDELLTNAQGQDFRCDSLERALDIWYRLGPT